MSRRSLVPEAVFVAAWNGAGSAEEAAVLVGQHVNTVRQRAFQLRRRGVGLKRLGVPHAKSLAEAFALRVEKTPDHWLWTGRYDKNQRAGVMTAGKKYVRDDWPRGQMTAHRVSYELHVGPIPEGACVIRTCENDRCVRPEHLGLEARSSLGPLMARRSWRGRPGRGKWHAGRLVLLGGRMMPLRDWVKEASQSYRRVKRRLVLGWGVSEAIFTPPAMRAGEHHKQREVTA